jgi:hypothetical protein
MYKGTSKTWPSEISEKWAFGFKSSQQANARNSKLRVSLQSRLLLCHACSFRPTILQFTAMGELAHSDMHSGPTLSTWSSEH